MAAPLNNSKTDLEDTLQLLSIHGEPSIQQYVSKALKSWNGKEVPIKEADEVSKKLSKYILKYDHQSTALQNSLWERVERIQTKEGHIFKYKLIDHKSNIRDKINDELFPAVQDVEFSEEILKKKSFWESLGYKFTENTIYLPDCKTLQAGYNELRKSRTKLPDFLIQPSDGIASDEEFVKAFINGKFILSNDDEFVHDHKIHLIELLHMINTEPSRFSEEHEILRNYVSKLYQLASKNENLKFSDYEKFIKFLAILVDETTSSDTNFHYISGFTSNNSKSSKDNTHFLFEFLNNISKRTPDEIKNEVEPDWIWYLSKEIYDDESFEYSDEDLNAYEDDPTSFIKDDFLRIFLLLLNPNS